MTATGLQHAFLLSPWSGGGIVNINAQVSGYNAGAVTAPVALVLSAGCYQVADASGKSGAIYDALNYHVGVANDWAWQYRIVNVQTGATILYVAAPTNESPATHYASELQASNAGHALGAQTFCLSTTTTVGFVVDDNYLPDNIGGVSLLVASQ